LPIHFSHRRRSSCSAGLGLMLSKMKFLVCCVLLMRVLQMGIFIFNHDPMWVLRYLWRCCRRRWSSLSLLPESCFSMKKKNVSLTFMYNHHHWRWRKNVVLYIEEWRVCKNSERKEKALKVCVWDEFLNLLLFQSHSFFFLSFSLISTHFTIIIMMMMMIIVFIQTKLTKHEIESNYEIG
jgi:hypothetical protein